jgi:CRP/FNR family transcriptional activator FtrB
MALTEADIERIRSIHLFKNVCDASWEALRKSASVRNFLLRTVIFTEGDRATALYLPIQGSVELFNENHVRRSTIAIIRQPRPFILTSISHDHNPLSARILERSQLLLIPLDIIHQLIDCDPGFTRAIMYELTGDLRNTIEDFKNHRLRPAIERLAVWMMRSDQDAGGIGRFVIPYDKRTLASYLGMAPENLSRSLVSLASVGVSVQGRHVSLNNPAALAALARMEFPPKKTGGATCRPDLSRAPSLSFSNSGNRLETT